jgi:uncharacterized protein YndB with AHSA1/START domain
MPLDGISVRRWLRARPERVFEAWTRPELMTRWLFPGEAWNTHVEADLRIGGRYRLDMHEPDGALHRQFGEYREIVPVSRLVFTWSCPELEVVDSVVTVELEERDGGTELILTHELPPDPDVRSGHERGWEGCLGNLERWLNEGRSMNTIKDEIRIKGTANAVYQALVTQQGYRSWWNRAGEIDEVVGGEAKLHFIKDGKPVNMRFRIDEMKTNERVRWSCVAHDLQSWVGTTLSWRIEQSAGTVLLSFEHAGWKEDAPEPVVQGWKHFLGSLKAYVETGTGQPW